MSAHRLPSVRRLGAVVELPSSPHVQVLGDAVVLRGAAALDVYRLVTEGIATVRRRDAIEPSPRLHLVVAALKLAASAAIQPADTADTADVREPPSSGSLRSGQQVGVREVAELIGIGHRQARRLAPTLGGHKKRNGEWSFDLGLVRAYMESERC